MPSQSLEERITDVIAHAVAQVANLLKADIIAQLQGTTAPRTNGVRAGARAAASAPKPRGRRGRRGTLDEATVARVFKVIEDNPGLRTEEIYKKLPLPADQAKKALAKLRADGRVKTKGQKRATTYAAA